MQQCASPGQQHRNTAPAPTYDPKEDWDAGVRAYFEAAFGAEHFARMSAALMRPPLGTCLRVNPLRTTPQSVIERLPACLSGEDAAMLADSGAAPRELPDVPGVVIVPGTGPRTVDYSAAGGKEVVISRKAGESVMRGAQPFLPGCLAASSGLEAGDTVAVSVAVEPPGLDWLGMTRGTTLGPAVERLGLPDRRRLHIGLGRAMFSRGDLFSGRGGVGVLMTHRVFANPSCDGIMHREVMLQNLPSVIAAQALNPAPGSRVLDMCAAPGGKTTALGQLMGDSGLIIALERSGSKVPGIRAMAEEFGLTCITAMRMDSTKAVLQNGTDRQRRSRAEPQQAAVPGGGGTADGVAAAPAASESPPAAAANGGDTAPASSASADSRDCADSLPEGNDSGAAPGAAADCRTGGGASPPAAANGGEDCTAGDGAAAAAAPGPENERQQARRERKAAGMRMRGLQPPPRLLSAATEPVARGFPPGSFDSILLDGPCTALGIRPRLIHRAPLWELAQAAEQQRRLIDAAAALLRPGGHLLYSTCTINPGENEANVRYTLDAHPTLELVPHKPYIGGPGLTGPSECAGAPASEAAAAAARARRKGQLKGSGKGGGARRGGDGDGFSLSAASGAGGPSAAAAAAGSEQLRQAAGGRAASHAGTASTAAGGAGAGSVQALELAALAAAGCLVGRGLTRQEAALVQRFDPSGPRDTAGFFIAKFRKRK